MAAAGDRLFLYDTSTPEARGFNLAAAAPTTTAAAFALPGSGGQSKRAKHDHDEDTPFVCATQTDTILHKIESNFEATRASGLTIATDSHKKPLVWGMTARSNLTWSCAEAGIAKYADEIAKAFDSWSSVCNVVFRKVDSAGFINVRWANAAEDRASQGRVIAQAFFPGEADRSLRLFQVFKEQGAFRLAVVRHEIGHVLGFRHEHIWFADNPTGERPQEGGLGAQLVTAKDKDSIMNYRKMWKDSAAHPVVVTDLSRLDKIGARLIYGTPASVVNFLF